MSAGRPTDYSLEICSELCARIAEGDSVRTICESDEMPSKATVFRWLAEHEEFRDLYEKACSARSDFLVEEILDIADDGTNDWIEKQNKDGSTYEALNAEHVQRSRLRVDARKWIASKLKPKKYGEKVSVEATGKDGKPLIPPAVHIYLPSNGRD
jgi:hypothetical protein